MAVRPQTWGRNPSQKGYFSSVRDGAPVGMSLNVQSLASKSWDTGHHLAATTSSLNCSAGSLSAFKNPTQSVTKVPPRERSSSRLTSHSMAPKGIPTSSKNSRSSVARSSASVASTCPPGRQTSPAWCSKCSERWVSKKLSSPVGAVAHKNPTAARALLSGVPSWTSCRAGWAWRLARRTS